MESQLKVILDKYFKNVPEEFTQDTELKIKKEYREHKIKILDLYKGIILRKITSSDIAS